MYNSEHSIIVFNEDHIDEVDWESQRVDVVVDASGVLDNVLRARRDIEKNKLRKTIVIPV